MELVFIALEIMMLLVVTHSKPRKNLLNNQYLQTGLLQGERVLAGGQDCVFLERQVNGA